jgi:hypothetical protein
VEATIRKSWKFELEKKKKEALLLEQNEERILAANLVRDTILEKPSIFSPLANISINMQNTKTNVIA